MREATSIHPEDSASSLSKFFVTWINPLLRLASKRQLQESDVWSCPQDQTVECQTKLVWDSWLEEKELALIENRPPSLTRAIVRGFLKDILIGGAYQLSFLFFQLVQPYFVGFLVAFLQSNQPLSVGVGYAIGLGLVSLCSSLSLTQCFFSLRKLGISLRTGMMMAVYQQSLLLSAQTRQQSSVGQLVNLLAIDSEKLFLAVQYVHFTWHGPLMSILVMILLVFEVGYAPSLVGMAWIFVLIPLQNIIARRIGNIRRVMVKQTDERVKLTNEVLQAIRVIKLYCWEGPIEERLMAVRKVEVNSLITYLTASSYLRELLFAAGPIAALVIFTMIVYGLSEPLNIVQIFQVLAFVNILRFPLNLLGQALKALSDGQVSIVRLNKFFMQPTLAPTASSEDAPSTVGVQLSAATFSWQEDTADKMNNEKEENKSSEQSLTAAENNTAHAKSEEKKEQLSTPIGLPSHEIDSLLEGGSDADVSHGFKLRSLSLTLGMSDAKKAELIAIVGSVGSGKSSFMSALLHEMPLLRGEFSVSGRIAFCAQSPWIMNVNLRNNVLFGADYNDKIIADLYERALDAAALRSDLEILPAHDLTEIGERGINLSGGQKARVSIARALVASRRADIILLDDPFSALDGTTGNKIFEAGILDMLSDKLRIVALNSHLHLLPKFDRVIILDQGRVVADGTPDELMRRAPILMQNVLGKNHALGDTATGSSGEAGDNKEVAYKDSSQTTMKEKKVADKLMATEGRAVGAVSTLTYLKYFGGAFYGRDSFQAMHDDQPSVFLGLVYTIVLLLVFTGAQVARVGIDLSLAYWAEDYGSKTSVYVNYYYGSTALMIALLAVRSAYLNSFSVLSASKIHRRVFRKVLSAPIPTFFDTHTVGEVLNRFSKDTEIMDSSVPEFMLQVLINWLQIFSVFALCIWATPYFLIVMVPLIIGFTQLFNYFSKVSGDLKRLESTSRSPVYAAFSETITGLQTIRAYGDTARFRTRYLAILERNHKFFFHMWLSMCWVTVRLEIATSFILFAVAILSVCLRDSVSQVTLGLSLSYGLQLTALFQRCVLVSIDVATYMTSAERVLEYLDIPSEPSVYLRPQSDPSTERTATELIPLNAPNDVLTWSDLTSDQQKTWPTLGQVEFRDVWMKYRANDPVLRGISFKTKSAERIGVCGRTGAGKSSLLAALFRVNELLSGVITLDGVNVASVPLHVLRSRLAIIPQDPVLFTGDIRFQLDPFKAHSDQEIWDVLQQVNLKDHVSQFPAKLQEPIFEGGGNLSQGQRQLLCIARALLRRAAVLVIDEGTSAVDSQTDALVQEALRTGVSTQGATIIAIAHRLQTIVDFDRILVLGEGKVLEYDTPTHLLSLQSSNFSTMYRSHL